MRLNIIFILLITLVSISCSSYECTTLQERWKDCEEDNDCEIIRDPCDNPMPVNKKCSKKYEEHLKQHEIVMHCSQFSEGFVPEGAKIRCISNKCVLKLKPKRL